MDLVKPFALIGLLSLRVSGQSPVSTLSPNGKLVQLPAKPPITASGFLPPAFVSFSIEFASFPDYGGNLSHPNLYSDNLLNNIATYQGNKPYIRVGGTTQDYALMDGYLKTALNYTKIASQNEPTVLEYGGSFFESYQTFANTKFIHGFNLAKQGEGYLRNLEDGAIVACGALKGRLLYWELGNEPDMYAVSSTPAANGNVRPKNWNDAAYATEWLNVTRQIRQQMGYTCKDMVTTQAYKFIAPSFAGTQGMDPWEAFQAGIDKDNIIAEFSSHSYMTNTPNDASISLEGTLMNHSAITATLAPQFALARKVIPTLPFSLTETHSLPAPGKPGLTDVFGAALWALDFNLLAAANNVSRVHAHQTTDSRAAAWQPIRTTNGGSARTLPQYYGHVATAAMVGLTSQHPTNIVQLASPDKQTVVYAAYMHSQLARVMLISLTPSPSSAAKVRRASQWAFQAPIACQGNATVARLTAAGHDATAGVSWNGLAFEADLGQGRPQAVQGVMKGEVVKVAQSGAFIVNVPDSSAAMVTLNCSPKVIQG